MCTIEQLLEKIEIVRKELISVVEKQGYHNPRSLAISKKLDHLLNVYECTRNKYNERCDER